MERRRQQQLQEDADRKMALSLQAQENTGASASSSGASADSDLLSTGRVAAALMDDSSSSKYRSSPNLSSSAATSTATSTASSLYRSSSSAAASSSSPQGQGNESHQARERYGKQKGISSDQFFGRDQEDEERARGRLQQLSGSSSISSDMIHSDGAPSYSSSMDMVGSTWSSLRTTQSARSGPASGTALDKLSESVAGFFDDIQKRIG